MRLLRLLLPLLLWASPALAAVNVFVEWPSTNFGLVFEQQLFVLRVEVFGDQPTGSVTLRGPGLQVTHALTPQPGSTTMATVRVNVAIPKEYAGGTHFIFVDYLGDAKNATMQGVSTPIPVKQKANVLTDVSADRLSVALGDTVQVRTVATGLTTYGGSLVALSGFSDQNSELSRTLSISHSMSTVMEPVVVQRAGTHSYRALLREDTFHRGVGGTPVSVVVAKGTPSVTLTPSATTTFPGKAVTLTAALVGRGVVPTGSVEFLDGATLLGSSNVVNGVAALTTAFTTLGPHALTARTAGDVNYVAGAGTSAVTIVAKPPTTTSLTLSRASAFVGQSLTASVSVTGANQPSGMVTVVDALNQSLRTITLTNGAGSGSISVASAGTASLRAVYSGDDNNAPSSSAAAALVVSPKVQPTVTLAASTTVVDFRQPTSLTVVLTNLGPGTAPSTVTILDGATTIATLNRTSTTLTTNVAFSTGGAHVLTARYGGNESDLAATSSPLTITVPKRATRTGVTLSRTTYTANEPVTFGVGVAVLGAEVGQRLLPSSIISLVSGTTDLRQGSLRLTSNVSAAGTLTHTFTSPGQYTVAITLRETANTLPSVSSSVVLTIMPPPPPSPAPVAKFEYDAEGLLTRLLHGSSADAGTVLGYNRLGQLTSLTDPMRGVTQWGYDGLDVLQWTMDPNWFGTDTRTNGLGQGSLLSPDTWQHTRVFGDNGLVSSEVDARGAVQQFQYDALGRLTTVSSSLAGQSSSRVFTYDEVAPWTSNGIGNITSTQTADVTHRMAYDDQGRVVRQTSTWPPRAGVTATEVTAAVAYSYSQTALQRIDYPSGRVVEFRSSKGMPSEVIVNGRAIITAIDYRFGGTVAGWTWQTNQGPFDARREFDSYGRLVRYHLGSLVREVTYDAAHRITAYTHTNPADAPRWNQSFTYDGNDRLTSFTRNGVVTSYSYDPNGNRLSQVVTGRPATNYTLSGWNNWLASSDNPTRIYRYDKAGNLLTDGVFVAQYDATNRLASITTSGQTLSFGYDAQERRTRKTTSSTLFFVYDPEGHLLGEYDVTGRPVREYVWLGAIPVAVLTDASATPTISLIAADHLNTPRVVTSMDGVVRWRWLADPFGESLPEEDPAGVGAFVLPLRFPGQYFDAETGLHANRLRYYSPTLGRYLESDPVGLEGGVNTYAYAENQPTAMVDPNGTTAFAVARAYSTGYRIGEVISPYVSPALARALEAVMPIRYEIDDFLTEEDKKIKDAEHAFYHMTCDEKAPDSLSGCERAKWVLAKQERCLSARANWDRKWWPGRHKAEIEATKRAVNNAEAAVRRECRCKN